MKLIKKIIWCFSLLLTLIMFCVPAHAESLPRIVGGTEVSPAFKYTWMVGLINAGVSSDFDGHFCGGSLISSDLVLTAAHCIVDDAGQVMNHTDIEVLVGAHDLNNPSENQGIRERIRVSAILKHENYDSATTDNDIALLRLSKSVNTSLAPVRLIDNQSLAVTGSLAKAIGWGNTSSTDEEKFLPLLQEVDVPVVSQATCASAMSSINNITDNMLCAGYSQGGKDSCKGDSGGPLVIFDTDHWEQAGIVSWGAALCAQPDEYGVYTKVYNYLDWINANTVSGLADVIGILKVLSGIPVSDPWKLSGYDVLKDGKTGSEDAIFFLQKIADMR
ncbi:MAG: serine protease [Desulfococcaceae bacterium]